MLIQHNLLLHNHFLGKTIRPKFFIEKYSSLENTRSTKQLFDERTSTKKMDDKNYDKKTSSINKSKEKSSRKKV